MDFRLNPKKKKQQQHIEKISIITDYTNVTQKKKKKKLWEGEELKKYNMEYISIRKRQLLLCAQLK